MIIRVAARNGKLTVMPTPTSEHSNFTLVDGVYDIIANDVKVSPRPEYRMCGYCEGVGKYQTPIDRIEPVSPPRYCTFCKGTGYINMDVERAQNEKRNAEIA